MNDEIELSVTVTVQDGARHAYVEWQPGDADAMELAIEIACGHAAAGYVFRGIRHGDGGAQSLWLAQQP